MNIVLYWHNQVRKYGERPAYRRKVNGEWVFRSWKEYGEVVRHFAMGLLAHLMQLPGQHGQLGLQQCRRRLCGKR